MKKFCFVFMLCLSSNIELFAQSSFQMATNEGNYILACQYLNSGNPANGAINNVFGAPTWVVPRENALAILGLIEATRITGNPSYIQQAQISANYLISVQDATDGAWFDQYSYAVPYILSKSPTQTAEVMIALYNLGFDPTRYQSMKLGAQFLLDNQNPANKTGNNDGLLGGGKAANGTWYSSRWASDNSFAYQALKAAQLWAEYQNDFPFAATVQTAADQLLNGINTFFYVTNPADPSFGVWHKTLDNTDTPLPGPHEWINYAPQMIDVPANGVNSIAVGDWIHNHFQHLNGGVAWDDGPFYNRLSPGYSFQASLAWADIGQLNYVNLAKNWVLSSGLWQTTPDFNNISFGWIDWTEPAAQANWWERFIDTSFYAISTFRGGYDFGIASSFNTGYGEISSPVIVDLNNDGKKEIVFTHFTDSKVSAYTSGGQVVQGWPITSFGTESIAPSLVHMPPTVLNIPGLRSPLIITGVNTISGKVYVIAISNKGKVIWSQNVSILGAVQIAIDDLNNDGYPEIVASGGGGIFVLSYKGSILNRWLTYGVSFDSTVAIGDLDRDGFKDIVFASGTQLYAINRFGTPLLGWPVTLLGNGRSPALGNVKPGIPIEVIASDQLNNLYLFNARGFLQSGWPINLGNAGLGSAQPSLFNFDSDPEVEIIAQAAGNGWFGITPQVAVFDELGNSLFSANIGGSFLPSNSAIAIDIDNSNNGIEVVLGTDISPIGDVRVFPPNPLWSKMLSSGGVRTSLAADDINGDGKVEIVAPTSTGDIKIFLTEGTISNLTNWHMYRANNQRTGRY